MTRRRTGVVALAMAIVPLALGTGTWVYHARRAAALEPLSIGMPALEQNALLYVAANDEARWMLDQSLVPTQVIPNLVDTIYLDALKAVKPEVVSISP